MNWASCIIISAQPTATQLLSASRLATSLWWLLSCITLLIVLSFLYKPVSVETKRRLWSFVDRSLMPAFAVLWTMGFVIYAIGSWMPELSDTGDFWAVVPFAIIDATRMFIFSSDLPAVNPILKQDVLYMGLFSAVHFAASFFSLIFVLRHFGFYLIEKLRVWLAGVRSLLPRWFFGRRGRKLYVIYGTDSRSLMMADSIRRSVTDADIAVVQNAGDDDVHDAAMGISRILGRASLKNSLTDSLRGMGYLIMFTKHNLTNGMFENGSRIIRDTLELTSLERIMRNSKEELLLFFLGEDEEENLSAAVNILKDSVLLRIADRQPVRVFCRAHRNCVNRVAEDRSPHENVTIRLVDAADISIEMLKQSAESHPVNYVSVEADGTVSSLFHALIIGCGDTGQTAVRFLYEFGAFVATGSTDADIQRSPFRCDVVDKDMHTLAPLMMEDMPAMDMSVEDGSLVVLHDIDTGDKLFSDCLRKWICTLNYVVIATEDNERNMMLAVRILRLAMRYRRGMDFLRINVRITRDADGHLHDAADHWNRLVKAEMHAVDGTGHCHQRIIESDCHPDGPIVLFGYDREIYTYDHVVKDKVRIRAKKYKQHYDETVNALLRQSGETENKVVSWDTEQASLMQLTDEWRGYSPTYSAVMRLRRIQSQNMQNSFHILTKRMLMRRALGDGEYERLLTAPPQRKHGTVEYEHKSEDSAAIKALHTLARTEHLRWVASHEALGYQDYATEKDKDEARLLHGCMKPWHELSELVQSYDYDVVDTSLILDI